MSSPEWWWFASPLAIAYAGIGLHVLVTAVRHRHRPAIRQQRRRGAPPT
ncbi:MAG: hypothetical protein ACRDXB_03540 [Actinomycetes bacterium]